MIVADAENRAGIQRYIPYAQCGGTRVAEEQKAVPSQRLPRGPSAFIPVEETLQQWPEAIEHQLGLEVLSSGRPDNVMLVMGLHPDYLSSFWKMQGLLLKVDGPLPCPWRHYIAIMASARHQCSYLISFHLAEFLQVGGDPEWLLGIHRVPQKLRNLNKINKLLAHRPWLVTKEHIEERSPTRGQLTLSSIFPQESDQLCLVLDIRRLPPVAQALLTTGEHSWSLAELIQAVFLLTHCHSLASFVFGCGILPEGDPEGNPGLQVPSPLSEQSSPPSRDPLGSSGGFDAVREVEALMERLKILQECQLQEEVTSQEEMESWFELEKSESLLVAPTSDILELNPSPDVLCFVEDPTFGYEDFTRRGTHAPPTFRAQDYTWKDHGYSLIQRLYPEVGQLLDEKFQVVYTLTYNTIAMHSGVDTSVLRRAIWNYIHCIFGIRYDDYDYGEVNQLLERNLKVYIKTVACYPEKTTKRMYSRFWRHFLHSEKVHVNLLLLEARMQAALLYALRAITQYMT